jgi:p-aminobenzoyl-glutamate transporter AbgT
LIDAAAAAFRYFAAADFRRRCFFHYVSFSLYFAAMNTRDISLIFFAMPLTPILFCSIFRHAIAAIRHAIAAAAGFHRHC